MCFDVFLLGLSCPGHVWEVFSCYFFKCFLKSFLSLSFWNPYNASVGAFNVVPEVSEAVFIAFFTFFFSYILWQWFPPFCPPAYLSILPVILLLIPSSVLFISVCSLVLLDLWQTFLASSPLFSQDPGSSSLSLFWTLSGRLPSSTWFSFFSGVLSCPFIWDMCLVALSCTTLCDHMDCSPPGFSVHGNSPDKNTGVGCRALLQGIFPTQGLNPGLLHYRQIL